MHRKMKKPLLILLLLALPVAGKSAEVPDWLIGTWQSNEKLTLADMNRHPEVSQKARKFFENKFFGRDVQIFRKNDSTSYFVDDKPAHLKYEAYEKISVNGDTIKIVDFNNILGKMEHTIYREGQCFYVLVSKWEFKEYFCPRDQ